MPSFDKVSPRFSATFRASILDVLKKNPKTPVSILIIGGGIVGAGLARELALGGAKNVFLVEKGDFASGTSGASSKLIHAGIRYLEQAWNELKKLHIPSACQRFSFVWDASKERKILGDIAPHLVQSKKIHFVVGAEDERPSLSVLAGVWLYYLLQIAQGQFFPLPEIFSRKRTIKAAFPGLNENKVKSIFSFWDAETEDAALTMENLRFAFSREVTPLNYVEFLEGKREGKGWLVRLKDNVKGDTFDIAPDYIINATGPFLDATAGRLSSASGPLLDRVAGGHIDLHPCPVDKSFYITASDGRLVFVLKRTEGNLVYARVGTTERPLKPEEGSDHPSISEKEEQYLTDLVRDFFPGIKFSKDSMARLDEGIRALTRHERGETAFQKSREHRLVWEDGLLHVAGVKLTDFRRVAEEALAHPVFRRWARPTSRLSAKTAIRPPKDPLTPFKPDFQLVARETMVVKWEDLYERRLGLLPRVLAKENEGKLREAFDSVRKDLGWSENEFRIFPARRGEAAGGGEPL